jgi:hypothetical protein
MIDVGHPKLPALDRSVVSVSLGSIPGIIGKGNSGQNRQVTLVACSVTRAR